MEWGGGTSKTPNEREMIRIKAGINESEMQEEKNNPRAHFGV